MGGVRWKTVIRKIFAFPAIALIQFYRKCISPLFPPCCRFHPTCSSYALEVFRHLPPHRALWLAVWRIIRCNPFNAGGYDPPPVPGWDPEPRDPLENDDRRADIS